MSFSSPESWRILESSAGILKRMDQMEWMDETDGTKLTEAETTAEAEADADGANDR